MKIKEVYNAGLEGVPQIEIIPLTTRGYCSICRDDCWVEKEKHPINLPVSILEAFVAGCCPNTHPHGPKPAVARMFPSRTRFFFQ
jgi:hypothetical protein